MPGKGSKYREFYDLSGRITCMSPRQPIKLNDLDTSPMNNEGLRNKYFCKEKFQISPMTWQKLSISIFPIISLWEL